MVRTAFTLIELIFAIVIIAISVVSLPMMNQVVSSGVDSSLKQEAIFAAATELNEVVAAHWDQNSLETTMLDSYAKVIETGDCINNVNSSRYRLRPGHINQPLHRRCLDSTVLGAADSNASIAVVDLDDMAHSNSPIVIGTTSEAGYKDIYTSTITVSRPANFAGVNNNIKMITSQISDSDGALSLLRTYSANIGEVDYYKRRL